MSDQYQPTAYYDWVNRTHGIHLVTGNYELVPYDYYAGDELHMQNVVFRNSEYVTHDNTHVRFLNKSDIDVYDTSSLTIYDSGTLTMHTSSAPGARTFIVDEIGRVGIGMNHLGEHASSSESPSFDLDVRGQVGIEDYIYHNDDTDTYMLFGTDTKAHHVNADGSITPPITPPNQDYDEVNFRVGGVDMLQMKEDDTQDVFVVNKNQADVDTIIRTSTNTQAVVVSGDGSEVVINGDGNSDTDFRVEGDTTPHMLYVDTSEDHVTINGAANDDTDLFTVTGNDNASLSGASLLSVSPTAVVINEDSNLIDTRIESNTNTTSILVKGDGTEVVINDDGNGDTDFRIESDKSEKMLFVDASTDMITLSGPGDGDDTAIFDIQGNDDDDLTGASLFYVDPTETVLNRDANDHNFRVVAQNLDPQQDTTDTGTDGNVQNHTAALASHALFVDATNGRVGLGHSNPVTTLHVAGSAHIEGDLWVKGVTNQIDTLIHATSAMDITNIGTGPALTVTQSGAQPVAVFWDRDNDDVLQASLYLDDQTKMGVGTSTPQHALHVSDTIESQGPGPVYATLMVDHNYNHGGIGVNSTTGNTQNHLRFYDNGVFKWQLRQPLQYVTNPDSIRFSHDDYGDVLTLLNDGNVGIGMSDPFIKLYLESTDGVRIPVGDTSQRPVSGLFGLSGLPSIADFTPMYGTIRYNTELQTFEGFGPGDTWGSLGGVIDIDRDTYWTALNDIDGDYYPDDPDHLRAFVGGNPVGTNNPGSTSDSEYGNDTSSTLVMDIERKSSKIYNSVYIQGDGNLSGSSDKMERIIQTGSKTYYEKVISFQYTGAQIPTKKINVAILTQGMNRFNLTVTGSRNYTDGSNHLAFGYVSVEGYTYWEADRDFTHTVTQENHSIGELLLESYSQGVRSTPDADVSSGSSTDGNYFIQQLNIQQNGSWPNTGPGPYTCELLVQLEVNNQATRDSDIQPNLLPEVHIIS